MHRRSWLDRFARCLDGYVSWLDGIVAAGKRIVNRENSLFPRYATDTIPKQERTGWQKFRHTQQKSCRKALRIGPGREVTSNKGSWNKWTWSLERSICRLGDASRQMMPASNLSVHLLRLGPPLASSKKWIQFRELVPKMEETRCGGILTG